MIQGGSVDNFSTGAGTLEMFFSGPEDEPDDAVNSTDSDEADDDTIGAEWDEMSSWDLDNEEEDGDDGGDEE